MVDVFTQSLLIGALICCIVGILYFALSKDEPMWRKILLLPLFSGGLIWTIYKIIINRQTEDFDLSKLKIE
jgi:hypothetical protein